MERSSHFFLRSKMLIALDDATHEYCNTQSKPCGPSWWLSSKESACNARGIGSISGSERSLGEGNGNPIKYSCLRNPMDRGGLWATVSGVAKELDMS